MNSTVYKPKWTGEQITLLRTLYLRIPRLTHARIQETINESFGTDYSLSAIDGQLKHIRAEISKPESKLNQIKHVYSRFDIAPPLPFAYKQLLARIEKYHDGNCMRKENVNTGRKVRGYANQDKQEREGNKRTAYGDASV
jgi:hypothetical protein